MIDLSKLVLKQDNDKAAFNCFEQQIMALCLYIRGEYWRLFLNDDINFLDTSSNFLEDKIEIVLKASELLKEMYNIEIMWEQKNCEILLNKDEIYLGSLKFKDYEFTKEIEEKGWHVFLIYGEDEKNFFINDNYYRVSNYKFNKTKWNLIQKKKVYPINIYSNINYEKALITKLVIKKFSKYYYDVFLQINMLFNTNKIKNYNTQELSDKLQYIYAAIKKDSLIAKNIAHQDTFLKICAEELDDIANKVRAICYTIIRVIIKYEGKKIDLIIKNIQKIKNILVSEKKIKKEIISILEQKYSLKDRLTDQVIKYIGSSEIDMDRLVCDDHEGIAILLFINYLEDLNNVRELDFMKYQELKSYREYLFMTYRIILSEPEV